MGAKVSWGYISYILKSYYNPEFNSGSQELKVIVEQALAATDLFFGLVNALLKTADGFHYYAVGQEQLYSPAYQKVKAAAENYARTLGVINQTLQSKELERSLSHLQAFFQDNQDYVKWMELAPNRTVLLSSPLDIRELVGKTLQKFSGAAFVDCLGGSKLPLYFKERLGLEAFQDVVVSAQSKGGQGQLFGNSLAGTQRLEFHCLPETLTPEKLNELLTTIDLPAAVLFGSSLQVKDFHEQYYHQLQKRAFLLVQSSSGGTNKLFHNFTIHNNSLLIATDKFLLKHIQTGNGLEPVERLAVKSLILCHLPFEQFTHPYQQALAARYANAFEEFSLPKALYNLHCLLKFFFTDSLEHLYICDSKLAKGYSRLFVDYIKDLPGVEIPVLQKS